MKHLLLLIATAVIFSSCERDEGKLPGIALKSYPGYTCKNDTLPAGSTFLAGIDASKSEDKDVLKKFNITKYSAGGSTNVFTKNLSGSEGNNFSYDYTGTVDSIPGNTSVYTFTITNRDGLVNQVEFSVTAR